MWSREYGCSGAHREPVLGPWKGVTYGYKEENSDTDI